MRGDARCPNRAMRRAGERHELDPGLEEIVVDPREQAGDLTSIGCPGRRAPIREVIMGQQLELHAERRPAAGEQNAQGEACQECRARRAMTMKHRRPRYRLEPRTPVSSNGVYARS